MASLVVVAVLAVLAGAGLSVNQAIKNEVEQARSESRALYLAEAGINESLSEMAVALANHEDPPTAIGTESAPRRMRSGLYWSDIDPQPGNIYTVTATGEVNRARRTIEVVLRQKGGGVFDNAIFAGNSSGDPAYTLELGGSGGQADIIDGSIFSGGDVVIDGDASVSGEISAAGAIVGGTGDENVTQPIPDIAGMAYETNHDYDVASLFAAATWEADDAGGSAWQLPETSPAHIFRKNPDDRGSENSSTAKDDFYLEDPYETVATDDDQDGSDPYLITLTGDSGSDKVFYVDGNLWVHNGPTFSFRFVNENGSPVRVTFVVKGNITFSDNIFYDDPDQDGLAFIAIEDSLEPDSGNIYFGDPSGGTLEYMDSYMYAENDFVDINLDASGSKSVELNGVMTAGNHVAIDRDFVNPDNTVSHSRLSVTYDDRISTGELNMPGLPSWQETTGGYLVLAWREVTPE